MTEVRFVYKNDNDFGPRILDRKTGRWMGLDLAKEYAEVVAGAVRAEKLKAAKERKS